MWKWRWTRPVLAGLATLFWVYVALKLFVADVDRALLGELADYRFLFFLAVLCALVLWLRKPWPIVGDGVDDGADTCPTITGDANGCAIRRVVVTGPTVHVPTPPAVPTVSFITPATPVKLSRPGPVEIELAVSGATEGTVVELLRGGDVICRWTTGPYKCTWNPDGASVGRNTLVAVARTNGHNAVVATRTVRMGRFLPAGLRASNTIARPANGRLQAITNAKIRLPNGVTPAQGCTGWATIRHTIGRTTIATRRARVKGDCTIRATARIRTVATPRRLRTTIRFNGNSVLAPATKAVVTKTPRA